MAQWRPADKSHDGKAYEQAPWKVSDVPMFENKIVYIHYLLFYVFNNIF